MANNSVLERFEHQAKQLVGLSHTYHWFNGKGVTDRHLTVRFVVAVVQNIGIGVKGLSNAVPAKVAHRGKAPGHNVIFNDRSNILVVVAGLHKVTGRNPRIVCGLEQGSGLFVGFSRHEHFTAVSVKTVEVYGNVQIDNISFLQSAIVGNAVTNHFVDAGTTRLGESVIVQGRRIRSSLLFLFGFERKRDSRVQRTYRKENEAKVSECVL
jgi:hypothetical protein